MSDFVAMGNIGNTENNSFTVLLSTTIELFVSHGYVRHVAQKKILETKNQYF